MTKRKPTSKHRKPSIPAWTKAEKDNAARLFKQGSSDGRHIVGRRRWDGMRDSAPEENGPVRVKKLEP